MGNNTQPPADSTSPLPPPLPRFEWLHPSIDAPRLQWPDWLALLSDALAIDFPGETGLYLASAVYGHSCQAEAARGDQPGPPRAARPGGARSDECLDRRSRGRCCPARHWVIVQPDPDDSDADRVARRPR